jgi:hypothetical protein
MIRNAEAFSLLLKKQFWVVHCPLAVVSGLALYYKSRQHCELFDLKNST